jgi:hypothetical protein
MVETSTGTFEAASCAMGAVGGGPSPYPTIPMTTPTPAPPPVSTAPLGGLAGIPGLGPSAPLHLAATVGSVTGGAPAASGEACTIDIAPMGMGAPCRVDVACGGRSIYGGSNALCLPGGHGGTSAIDASSADGDPILTITSESGVGTVTSTVGAATWVVTLSFPPTPS